MACRASKFQYLYYSSGRVSSAELQGKGKVLIVPRESRTGDSDRTDAPIAGRHLVAVSTPDRSEDSATSQVEGYGSAIPNLAVGPAHAAWLERIGIVARIELSLGDTTCEAVPAPLQRVLATRLAGRSPRSYMTAGRVIVEFAVASHDDSDWSSATAVAFATAEALNLSDSCKTTIELL